MVARVSDTAATIARVRAEEGERPPHERLFEDPYAALFAGVEAVDDRFFSIPYFREAIRLRTRLIDDFVRAEIAAGVRQVVILGVGFDCRALRLREIEDAGVVVFEVDFAAQVEHKAKTLAAAGHSLPARVRTVPCDFTAPDYETALRRDLVAAGLRSAERAAILCEGVIGYLDESAANRVLRLMATLAAPTSAASVNYSLNRYTASAMRAAAEAAGFARVEDEAMADAHRRHLGADVPAAAELFRLAIART